MKYNEFMKIYRKILQFLCLLIFCETLVFSQKFASKNNSQMCFAEEPESTCYAKALDSCTLFKSESLSNENGEVLFIVPEGYFVAIVNAISESVLLVRYDKYLGYVSASSIKRVSFVPKQKTLTGVTLDIKSSSGTQIWSIPSTKGEQLYSIERGASGIKYIAKVYGELLPAGQSNLWYFVSYTPPESPTDVYTGYIYSQNVTNLGAIPPNTEADPEPVQTDGPAESGLIYLNSPIKTLIVTLVAVPIILLIAILLYRLVKHIRAARAAAGEPYYRADGLTQNSYCPENLQRRRPKLAERLKNFGRMSFVKRSNGGLDSERSNNYENYSAGYPQKYLVSSANKMNDNSAQNMVYYSSENLPNNMGQNSAHLDSENSGDFYDRNFKHNYNSNSSSRFGDNSSDTMMKPQDSRSSGTRPPFKQSHQQRKPKSRHYPAFPDYDTEDDLL